MGRQKLMTAVVRTVQLVALTIAVMLGVTAEPAAAQSRQVALTVNNQSSTVVYTLHMRASGRSTWSDDLLGRDIIRAGGAWTARIAPGTYDILALDRNGDTVAESYGVRITGASTWTIPRSSTFVVINESGSKICFLNISASNQSSWGDDVLGEDTTIPSGYNWTTTVAAGTYDVRGLDCEGEVVFEEYDLNLSRNLRLTVE